MQSNPATTGICIPGTDDPASFAEINFRGNSLFAYEFFITIGCEKICIPYRYECYDTSTRSTRCCASHQHLLEKLCIQGCQLLNFKGGFPLSMWTSENWTFRSFSGRVSIGDLEGSRPKPPASSSAKVSYIPVPSRPRIGAYFPKGFSHEDFRFLPACCPWATWLGL